MGLSSSKKYGKQRMIVWSVLTFLAFISGRPLFADTCSDMQGVWQGALNVARGFSLSVKFTCGDAGKSWTGELGTEESPEKHKLDSITLDKKAVSFAVPSLGVRFSGKITADGTSMMGVWTQGSIITPFELERRRAVEDVTTAVRANMPKAAHPKYEVAVIKLSPPDTYSSGFRTRGHSIQCDNERLIDMLSFAYGLHPSAIVNLDGWMTNQRFNVDGYPDVAGDPDLDQMRGMFRDLLETRFGLKHHMEKRVLPVYLLELGKSPLRISKSLGDPNGMPDQSVTNQTSDSITLRETNATMKDFTWMLDFFVADRPTMDQTGLAGRYDFVLTWNPNSSNLESNTTAKAPSIFGAIADLGLRLRAEKASYDVMVVDKVERPSEN